MAELFDRWAPPVLRFMGRLISSVSAAGVFVSVLAVVIDPTWTAARLLAEFVVLFGIGLWIAEH